MEMASAEMLTWLNARYNPEQPETPRQDMSKPRDPDSKTGRIREFFLNNDDEELTYEDIVVKFNITKRELGRIVQSLVGQGICESVHLLRAKKDWE